MARKAAPPLRKTVRQSIRAYLRDLGDTEAQDLMRRLLDEVEPPLIEEVLKHAKGNQTRAAKMLGITRNTLRERMRRHGIEPG